MHGNRPGGNNNTLYTHSLQKITASSSAGGYALTFYRFHRYQCARKIGRNFVIRKRIETAQQ